MTTIDGIQGAIELIRSGQADEAANELDALLAHLESICAEQRTSYAILQAFITNTELAYRDNRLLSEADSRQIKSEIARAKQALTDLIPAERQPVQLKIGEAA